MKNPFTSILKSELLAFLCYKRALGFRYERPEGTLRHFDRLDGQQDPHLRCDLDHARLQNAWATPTTAAGSHGSSSVILAP